MKTKQFQAMAIRPRQDASHLHKMLMALLVLAMLFASLPVAGVLAAPANKDRPWENAALEKEWKAKLETLREEGLFYTQARLYPADFEDSAELARAWDLLHKHGAALRQANTVLFNHSGFDFEGNVTNERLAYDSVHELGMYLTAMRGFRMKIAEEGYKVHRLK